MSIRHRQARLALVELLPLDNEFDAAKAIEPARWMIREKVDFAIECQRHAKVAPVLADMFARAHIPTLAIDIPQPGALYFGPNNYTTGLTLGEAAGGFVYKKWRGGLDQVLLLEAFAAGPHPHSRIMGFLEGLQGAVKGPGVRRVVRRDGKGTEEDSYRAALKFFREVGPRKRVLIAAINDIGALGAVRAARELGREQYTGIVGHDLSPAEHVLAEIKDPNSPFIASICTFPEEYGGKILSIILRWLRNGQVPPHDLYGNGTGGA